MLRLLGGALFPGLFFLKAFKLPAAFFGLPFFAALGTGALPRFLGICCGRLRIRFTLVGPDGRALRLRLLLRMDGRKANGVSRFLVRRCLRIGRAVGRCGKPDSLTRLGLRFLTLCPAAEFVHNFLERVFRLLLLRGRLVQLCFVLRTPGWFHSVLHVFVNLPYSLCRGRCRHRSLQRNRRVLADLL